MSKYINPRNIATFYLFTMTTQFIAFEGMDISMFKVGIMAISPVIWLLICPSFTKATLWSVLYIIFTVFSLYLQSDYVRSSTLWYSALFLSMFNLFYSLIYVKQVFTLDYFVKVIQILIYAYASCLLLQQLFVTVGIRSFPLINLNGMAYYSTFRLNTLAIEPSHAARVLTVAFYVLLECIKIKEGDSLSFVKFFKEHKKTILTFLYTMICMGSGTAFVGLGILSLYFIRKKHIAIIIPLFFILYISVGLIDYEPLTRAINVFITALQGDTDKMITVDHSASARVNIIINTVKYFDITDPQLWIGYGYNSNSLAHSAISDYGLLSYLSKLALFFSCCFSGLFTLPVLMLILLFSLSIGNIAYGWGALMMLSGLKYFKSK